MKYTEGYVAFIDILGFSELVSHEQNAEKVRKIFDFVEKTKKMFNKSTKLYVKIAFFSDSIILTSSKEHRDSLLLMFHVIWLMEQALYRNTQLYFRGAIVKGNYYNVKGIAFGPAIVDAYILEKKANYSRIIIHKDIIDDIIKNSGSCPDYIFEDFDGMYCLNPCIRELLRTYKTVERSRNEALINSVKEERKKLIQTIRKYDKRPVAEKYLWRIIPYNITCDILCRFIKDDNLGDENDIESCYALKISDFKILRSKDVTTNDKL